MNTKNLCYLNGEMLSFANAALPLNELGLLRGYGVFDYLRTYQGKPFALQAHFERLQRSAEAVGLSLEMTLEQAHETIEELLYWRADTSQEAGIRLLLTGGLTEDGSTYTKSNFAILIENFEPTPAQHYQEGTKVLLHEYRREMPKIKTTNYLQMYLRREDMKKHQAKDLLYFMQGEVSECTRNNFFIVKDKQLITSDRDVLEGITREVILKIAKNEMEVVERPIQLEELGQADEAFKAGTTNEMTPIVCIDSQTIGTGKVGKTTQHLHQLLKEYIEANS